ncbi:MAG: hypothetical protein HY287_08770 [Planctomycetes bacterium]|nr:hypothetical protein [Planctomycetota bacterium]MBI3834406.1 hypothetical protein [Planctomycetota bacterium]
MSIELNCPNCEHQIRAPDTAGGKHGLCPYCQTKVYIPVPVTDDDLIPIAPLDPDEEAHDRELKREAVRYSAAFDKEADAQGGAGDREARGTGPARRPAPNAASSAANAPAPGEVIDIAEEVERFVIAMRDSKLEDADRVVAKLKRVASRARDYVEGLLLDPTPPPIGNVPKPLLNGFLKSLGGRLS